MFLPVVGLTLVGGTIPIDSKYPANCGLLDNTFLSIPHAAIVPSASLVIVSK